MTTQSSTARPGAAVQSPPPDVAAFLAAARRLRDHADLLQDRHRQVHLEMERAPWESPAARAARACVEIEAATVAQHVQQLRSTAEEVSAYAHLVQERMAAQQRAQAALAASLGASPAPVAGAAA